MNIKISDDSAAPVTNATANVFYAQLANNVVGSDQEAASIGSTAPDGGNTMRYDPLADQYVFNWDTSPLTNGTYRVQVGLNEGSCAILTRSHCLSAKRSSALFCPIGKHCIRLAHDHWRQPDVGKGPMNPSTGRGFGRRRLVA